MIGPLSPDSLDPAVLRDQADLFDRIALQKRRRADMIELSVFTNVLSATDETGKRGIDKLVELDPIAALNVLRQIYARVAALALQITAPNALTVLERDPDESRL